MEEISSFRNAFSRSTNTPTLANIEIQTTHYVGTNFAKKLPGVTWDISDMFNDPREAWSAFTALVQEVIDIGLSPASDLVIPSRTAKKW